VTRRSVVEYAEAVRGRYFRAGKKAKTEILNEIEVLHSLGNVTRYAVVMVGKELIP